MIPRYHWFTIDLINAAIKFFEIDWILLQEKTINFYVWNDSVILQKCNPLAGRNKDIVWLSSFKWVNNHFLHVLIIRQTMALDESLSEL